MALCRWGTEEQKVLDPHLGAPKHLILNRPASTVKIKYVHKYIAEMWPK